MKFGLVIFHDPLLNGSLFEQESKLMLKSMVNLKDFPKQPSYFMTSKSGTSSPKITNRNGLKGLYKFSVEKITNVHPSTHKIHLSLMPDWGIDSCTRSSQGTTWCCDCSASKGFSTLDFGLRQGLDPKSGELGGEIPEVSEFTPEKWLPGPQKERLIFQSSFFRGFGC